MSFPLELNFSTMKYPYTIPKVKVQTLDGEVALDKHVLSYGYREKDGKLHPVLTLFDLKLKKVEAVDLNEVKRFKIIIDPKRYCVGKYRDEPELCGKGLWERWPLEQCKECLQEFVKRPNCVFAANCGSDECDKPACYQPHSVYLAFFGKIVKVGMTMTERFEKRLTEQAADAFVHVCTAPTRPAARTIEHYISKQLKLKEMVQVRMLIKTLEEPFDTIWANKAYEELIEPITKLVVEIGPEIERDWGKAPELVLDGISFNYRDGLDRGYIQNVNQPKDPASHAGEVVWIRGKLLIYRNHGTYAMRLDKLSSHLVHFEYE